MRRTALALVLIGAFALRPISAAPCDATVHAELSHVEPKELVTTHTFNVNVTTLEPCATIHFTLSTTERVSKTKVKVYKTPGEVRVRNGSLSQIVDYDMASGHQMVKWDVKVTGC